MMIYYDYNKNKIISKQWAYLKVCSHFLLFYYICHSQPIKFRVMFLVLIGYVVMFLILSFFIYEVMFLVLIWYVVIDFVMEYLFMCNNYSTIWLLLYYIK